MKPGDWFYDYVMELSAQGIVGGKYSYSAAIGLFNTVINFVILLTVNKIAGKMGDTSLF